MAEKVILGNIRKCPSCGAEVGAMVAFCPECGHEFGSIEANRTVSKLSEQLAGLKEWEISGAIQRTPIPTTKEDLLEFLSYAVPQAKVKVDNDYHHQEDIKSAWKAKANEAIIKARILLNNDPQALMLVEAYDKELKKRDLSSKFKTILTIISLLIILLVIGVLDKYGII